MRSLEKGAFYKCKRANSVSFSEDSACREIPDRTFAECRQMKILVLPDALEEIGAEAFYKCEELTRVRLPDTLRKIGKRGFYQCGLEELHLPEHLEYIGESAFLKCKKLEYVRVPESVRMIGKWAFHGCGRLKNWRFITTRKKWASGSPIKTVRLSVRREVRWKPMRNRTR